MQKSYHIFVNMFFLVDHPYNQTENALPYNVIRVSNWQEISEWIKNMN